MSSVSLDELESEIITILRAFKVDFKKNNLVKHVSVQFIVEDFGLIICGVHRYEYTIVRDVVNDEYEGWSTLYVGTHDDLDKKRYDILWSLMRGGYLKHLRLNYPREFAAAITMEGLGQRIINQRLKIWRNRPKFKYLIEDNESAKKSAMSYLLSTEPSFFDYMP